MSIGNRADTADDHKATSIHDPNALANDPMDSDSQRTFYAVKDDKGDVEILWQGNANGGDICGSFVLTTEGLRHRLDALLTMHIRDHVEKSDLHTRIASMLDRRIEVALKDFEKQAIQDAKNACREAMMKRVRAAVEAAPIRVEVTTQPASPEGSK